MSIIEHYLKSCRELTRCCSQNGWIDTESLRYSILIETGNELVVKVEFDELLMDGTGSCSRRLPCSGQVHLLLDRVGRIIRAEVL
jgi:hypothetical protein